MKNSITLLILSLIVVECNNSDNPEIQSSIEKFDTLAVLVGTNWNLITHESDSVLYNYNNQPLYFKNNYAYFFDQRIAELSMNQDSIFLRDTSYISSSNPKYDQQLSVKTYLVGILEAISKDSLVIRKVYGWGLPFYHSERYMFYNDTLAYDPNLKLNRLVYSTSLCYGECPAMAIEISVTGKMKFYGGEYSDLKGNYYGIINMEYIQKIEHELRLANIEDQPEYFSEPIDAPICEVIIYYNDGLIKQISGYCEALPPRLQNIAFLMHDSYKFADLDKAERELLFETKVHKAVYDR